MSVGEVVESILVELEGECLCSSWSVLSEDGGIVSFLKEVRTPGGRERLSPV
jgi:hypothetical protein